MCKPSSNATSAAASGAGACADTAAQEAAQALVLLKQGLPARAPPDATITNQPDHIHPQPAADLRAVAKEALAVIERSDHSTLPPPVLTHQAGNPEFERMEENGNL